MAGKKLEEQFESVEKEIKEVRASMEKGIGEMEKGIGEVRAELTQNLNELRQLMEEQMKLLAVLATTSEKTRVSTSVVEEDRDVFLTGVAGSRMVEIAGLCARNEEQVMDTRVLQNVMLSAGTSGLHAHGGD